jgi:hypothetical protein
MKIEEHDETIGICVNKQQPGVKDPDFEITVNGQAVAQGHSGRARRWSFFDR